MSISRRALLLAAGSAFGGGRAALAQNGAGAATGALPPLALLGGFTGDRLRRNISQWLKTFDIHRYVGLIEAQRGTGAGLMAGRWLAASVRAVEYSGDALLRQRTSGMLDRILAAQRSGTGAPFPEMTRADRLALAGALETVADFWLNGPAAALLDRITGDSSGEDGQDVRELDPAGMASITDTERVAAMVPEFMRVLKRTGDGRWGDAIESLLWNQVFACQTFEGDGFRAATLWNGSGAVRGGEKVGAAGALLLSELPWMVYGVEGDTLRVHQYGPSETTVRLGGKTVGLRQETSFPDSGEVLLHIQAESEFTLAMRIPGWRQKAAIDLNGRSVPMTTEKGYCSLRRNWKPGDVVALHFPLSPEWTMDAAGLFELRRGPVRCALQTAESPRVLRSTLREAPPRPDHLGRAYTVRVILESGQESTLPVVPFACAGWGGWYRSTLRAE